MGNFFSELWNDIKVFFLQTAEVTWRDIVDIFLVGLVIYLAVRFIRDRRAGKLILGVGFLVILRGICEIMGLSSLGYLLRLMFETDFL